MRTAEVKHADYCTDPTRIESYRAVRYGQDGITPVARPLVTRCITCGAQTVS
jgi:hypothetical protein